MANPNAVVSHYVRRVQPGDESLAARRAAEFELEGGRRVRLDPENPRSEGFARVLAGLAELRHPVYLEIDEATEGVSRLLVPKTGRVDSVREVDRGLEVLLEKSHARHLLSRESADFAALERTLRDAVAREAPLILTPDDALRIVDLRFFEPGPDDGPVRHPAQARPSWLDRLLLWRFWPWRWFYYRCLSPKQAQQIFDAMAVTTCNPLTVPPPCIPFLFPDDGCWARAHEMARLMIDLGPVPRKVWISGNLHTLTRNNPNCFVGWGWHVAPTLCVRRRWLWFWWWWGTRMVIDPSMFTTPVTVAAWKAAQGDPAATLNHTDWTDYWFGQTDPTFTDTNYYLGVYRLALLNRSNGPDGPPPYANCP
ncbi:MAG: protein-glutamine glutaminase family protein [Allosphingosinicella sp.]